MHMTPMSNQFIHQSHNLEIAFLLPKIVLNMFNDVYVSNVSTLIHLANPLRFIPLLRISC